MSEQNNVRAHTLTLTDRERMSLCGVCEVLSFDEDGVLLDTVMGTLAIDGEQLRVTRLALDTGEVDLCGKVNGIVYAEKTRRQGLFGKRK